MKYAIDLHVGDDWGGAPEHQTGYDFETRGDAIAAAVKLMKAQVDHGADINLLGAYVISDDAEANRGSPSTEHLVTLDAEGWLVERA